MGHRCALSVHRLPLMLRWWMLSLWLAIPAALTLPGGVSAAPPENWSVLRVFIPEDQVAQLVTPAYKPYLIESLQKELSAADQRRKNSLLESPGLAEAVYVARLVDGDITSDVSRWTMRGSADPQPVQIGQVSLALRAARGTVGGPQLFDVAQFTTDGRVEWSDLEQPVGWFGFFARGQADSTSRQRFLLRIPAAPNARMLLATPVDAQVSSPSVVVQRVRSATEYLPDNWPSGGLSSIRPELVTRAGNELEASSWRWWLIHLSGAHEVELVVDRNSHEGHISYQRMVRSEVEYSASQGHIEARAQFHVIPTNRPSPLRIFFDERLRLADVLVNDTPVSWHGIDPPSEEELPGAWKWIELTDPPLIADEDTRLEITAACPVDTDAAVALPELHVAGAYTVDGICHVRGVDGLVADDVSGGDTRPRRLANSRLRHLPRAEATSQGGAESTSPESNAKDAPVGPLAWQATWLGPQPPLTARFSRQRQPWTARSLTRFAIQSEWLSAHCRIHIDSTKVDSNEIRLTVGRNWFVDNVKLVGSSGDLRARVVDRELADSPLIVIGWEGKRESISLELEVVAHSPRDTSADGLSLRSPRLVSLPDADQMDNYVIESSSRFNVQLSSGLLRYQLQPSDLPQWQQDLLPPLVDKWIFQGVRGTIPPIVLTASGGTYSCKLSTIVRKLDEQYVAEATLRCLPISGSIDRVDVALPLREGVASGGVAPGLNWVLVQEDNGGETPLTSSVSSDESNRESLVSVELPGAFSTALTLRARIPLVRDGAVITVPILGMPAATYGESLLVLPRSLAAPFGETGIELLPAKLCCGDNELSRLTADMSPTEQATLIAGRMETGISQLLQLQIQDDSQRSGWVWRERMQHRLREDGIVEHDVEWLVESLTTGKLEVELPPTWQFLSAELDGVDFNAEIGAAGRLSFDLPRFARSTLRIHCLSRRGTLPWLTYDRLERAQISVPVLDRKETLAIPPSRVAAGSLLGRSFAAPRIRTDWDVGIAGAGDLPTGSSVTVAPRVDDQRQPILANRLLPSSWWRLLAPNYAWSNFPADAEQSGWSTMDLFDQPQPAVAWTIQRSALATLGLTVMLTLSVAFWICLGDSPRRWWLTLVTLVITAVLISATWLPVVQIGLLSLGCAGLLRLSVMIVRLRSTALVSRSGSGISNAQSSAAAKAANAVTSLAGPTLLLLVGLNGVAQAQSLAIPNGSSGSVEASAGDGGAIPHDQGTNRGSIFGVLIPVDEAGQVTGPFAYAPTRLLELLEGETAPTGFAGPRVLSADYLLRTRRSLLTQQQQVQEFSVEFTLRVDRADDELRLPFLDNQLTLLRGAVDGQELYIGGRSLYQVAEAVVFRPASAGKVKLQLQFEPRDLARADGSVQLKCAIPPIPSATLRVTADSRSSFQLLVDGRQRPLATSATELLGPLSQLEVQWSATVSRGGIGQVPAEVFADTWLHARGERVSAICQMRIYNARGLPRDLQIVAEPGWEPVGSDWGGGELIDSQLSALGGRQVYTIRCNENWNEATRRTLRVLMIPRPTESPGTLTLPFFSLQEVSQQAVTRTLAWSADADAVWRPDGLGFWQELVPTPFIEWGPLSWKATAQVFRIPFGNMATALRRADLGPSIRAHEITQVHLGPREARIAFRADCQTVEGHLPALDIPQAARVEALLVDGQALPYRSSQRGDQVLVEILPTEPPSTFRVIQLDLSLPVRLDRLTLLPRIVLRDCEASSSIYRVLATLGSRCELQASDKLALEQVRPRPSELLANLETLVGQVELGNDYRNAAYLPLQFKLSQRAAPRLLASLLTIRRGEQGWLAKLKTRWATPDEPMDFAFFELPVVIRDSVNTGQMLAQFMPMGDSGRSTLRLIPPPPIDGITEVEFDFPLPVVASSQAVAIPRVAVLADTPVYPALALPAELDQRPVQWLQTGRRLDPATRRLVESISASNAAVDAAWAGKFQYFELESSQSQARWKLRENNPERAELLVVQNRLLKSDSATVTGQIDYWLQPGGQLSLPISVPESCEVLGVEIGGQSAIWQNDDSRISVLLQPNYLPVNVSLLVRWNTTGDRRRRLPLPSVLLTKRSPQMLATLDSGLAQWEVEDGEQAPDSSQLVRSDLIRFWAEILIEAFPFINGQSSSEIASWLQHWQPANMGFAGGEVVSADVRQDALALLGIDPENTETVATTDQFWNAMALRAGTIDASPESSDVFEVVQAGNLRRIQPQQSEIVLSSRGAAGNFAPRIVAAGLLVVAAVLALMLAARLRSGYSALFARQPWLHWLQLAILAWLFLPVSWPSWLLLLTAGSLLTSQVVDTRRRQRLSARN